MDAMVAMLEGKKRWAPSHLRPALAGKKGKKSAAAIVCSALSGLFFSPLAQKTRSLAKQNENGHTVGKKGKR